MSDHVFIAALPSLRSDLEYCREHFDLWNDDCRPNEISIRCARCTGRIDYTEDYVDKQLSTFTCNPRFGCGRKWTEREVSKMTAAEIAAAFETILRAPDEQLYMFEEKSNGVSRYTATREMTYQEKLAYFRKALDHRRRTGK